MKSASTANTRNSKTKRLEKPPVRSKLQETGKSAVPDGSSFPRDGAEHERSDEPWSFGRLASEHNRLEGNARRFTEAMDFVRPASDPVWQLPTDERTVEVLERFAQANRELELAMENALAHLLSETDRENLAAEMATLVPYGVNVGRKGRGASGSRCADDRA
ncbi:MAG: hypothetical protein RIF41_02435 [Polyangiaceae bacterium]